MTNKKIYFSNCLSVRRNLRKFYFQTENPKLHRNISELINLLNDEILIKQEEVKRDDEDFYNSLLTIYDFM